jgi:hypothetical protein
MTPPNKPFLFMLWSTLLSVLAAAQSQEGPARKKVFGIVKTASGKIWVGAEVNLLARSLPDNEKVGSVDHLRVLSDQHGRFRAEIIAGRSYTAWAWSPVEIGRYRQTGVIENVFPSVPLILEESDEPHLIQRFRITGRDAWQHLEPLEFHFISLTGNIYHEQITAEEDGTLAMPRLPASSHFLEVRGRDAFPLHEYPLHRRPAHHPQEDPAELALPGPKVLGIAIRDIGTNQGIGGARIYRSLRSRLIEIARTEADGFVSVKLPVAAASSPSQAGSDDRKVGHETWIMMSDAPGHGIGALRRGTPKKRRDGRAWAELRKDSPPDYYCHLGPGASLKGRVEISTGVPARKMGLRMSGRSLHYEDLNHRISAIFSRVVETDAQGQFEISGLISEYIAVVDGFLSDEHILLLPESWRAGLSPSLRYMFTTESAFRKEGKAVVTLSDRCPIEFRLTAPGRAPAESGKIALHTLDKSDALTPSPRYLHTDRAGRLRILAPQRQDLALILRNEVDWDIRRLSVYPKAGKPDAPSLEIEMEEMLRVSGHVVDDKGKPIAAAEISLYPLFTQGLANSFDQLTDKDVGRVSLSQIKDPRQLAILARMLGFNAKVPTDKEGLFSFRIPRIPMNYRLYLRHNGVNTNIQIEVDDRSVEDLKIEIQR